MLGLEKLLDLQLHYNQLENSKKELYELESDQEISKLKRTYISDKKNLEKVLMTYKENEKNIKDASKELEEYGRKLKKVESTVYEGEITDLKQLEHMNKEKSYLENLIDELENRTLEFLEKNDKLKISIDDWQNKIIDKEKKIIDLEKSSKKSLSKLKKEIEAQEAYIEKYSKEVEPQVLEKFLGIKEKKNSGISTVTDNVCSECNIMIRPVQVDRIKLGKYILVRIVAECYYLQAKRINNK